MQVTLLADDTGYLRGRFPRQQGCLLSCHWTDGRIASPEGAGRERERAGLEKGWKRRWWECLFQAVGDKASRGHQTLLSSLVEQLLALELNSSLIQVGEESPWELRALFYISYDFAEKRLNRAFSEIGAELFWKLKCKILWRRGSTGSGLRPSSSTHQFHQGTIDHIHFLPIDFLQFNSNNHQNTPSIMPY